MNGPPETKVLDWDQVKDVAQEAFDVWVHGGELHWAQEVWTKMVAAGMANYSDEIQRHRVGILFLALAGLYRDFCAMAWDERNEPTYSYWGGELSLEAFVLGQLVGPDPGIEEDDALNHLVNAARSQVLESLMQLFGGINSLFVSLWRAGPDNVNDEAADLEEDIALTDDEILNDATPEKLAAYCWLESGADVVLDPY